MERFWTWSGRYIGVRQKDYLVSVEGRVLGRFYGEELYNANGNYIGEVQKENRIIKNRNKEIQKRPIFSRSIRGYVTGRLSDASAYPLIGSFEDFEYEE